MVGATYQLGRVLLTPAGGVSGPLCCSRPPRLTTIAGRFVRMDVWLTAFVAWGVFFWARVHFGGIRAGRSFTATPVWRRPA